MGKLARLSLEDHFILYFPHQMWNSSTVRQGRLTFSPHWSLLKSEAKGFFLTFFLNNVSAPTQEVEGSALL
jgi:hypothetical protein